MRSGIHGADVTAAVTIVDYGCGNLHSIANALRHLDVDATMAASGADLGKAGHVVLPGVGAFGQAMDELRQRGHDDGLRAHVAAGRPLLGICLGMQLLFDTSNELGTHNGLGILAGEVVALSSEVARVPSVGWFQLREATPSGWADTPLDGLRSGSWAYFVHSYVARATRPEDVVAVYEHGDDVVTAAVAHENVFGAQFHPEKSGDDGLTILKTYCEKRP